MFFCKRVKYSHIQNVSVNSVFIYVHVILIEDVESFIIVINHGNHNIQVYDTIININKLFFHLSIIYDITNIPMHQRLRTMS